MRGEMDTPICDFVRRYAGSDTLRLHMPGHKGAALLGMEALDITEIRGADSLYEAAGIIRRSEENASRLFGCPTFYSTEGSSQCIRAMLLLAAQNQCQKGERLRVLAGRNAHRTFLSACALLELEVSWLRGRGDYLSCAVTPDEVDEAIERERPHAVYLTSPDYLGNTADIAAIAAVCHARGVLLLVDNAHGAYLHFLRPPRHPMDLGADLCCDSAHKTLPALTGGAYLHVADTLPEHFAAGAKNALAMFGSTSPSYLILQSLDAVNAYLAEEYTEKLDTYAALTDRTRGRLQDAGYVLAGDEPMKLTLLARPYGYTGEELADCLRIADMECEFADPDYLVLMLTPETGEAGLRQLEETLLAIPRRTALSGEPPALPALERAMTIREAALAPSEELPAARCPGRVLASPSVGCPPAVPIAICGERLDEHAAACFAYYGVERVWVVREG